MTNKLRCASLCETILQNTNAKELKENFIETLAHDLKTPVLAQIRILELMNNGHFGKFTNQQKEILKITLESCEYMYEIISTLISTYRIDNEDFILNYSYFNFIKVIEESIVQVNNFVENNNLKIVIIPQINSPYIFADYVRLQKVIQTLVFNSLNRAYKNSIIKIYIIKNKELLSFKIESKSGYINPEKLEQMLKVNKTEKFDKIGTGIGLYMAKKIIEKHKGQLFATSNTKLTNIFGFQIPVKELNQSYLEKCI